MKAHKSFFFLLLFSLNSLADGFLALPVSDNTGFSCVWLCYTNHVGNDYSVAEGTNIYAAYEGIVINAVDNNVPNYNPSTYSAASLGVLCNGNYIKIDHGIINDKRYITIYLHLRTGTLMVKNGDRVSAGQLIAQSGNSGRSGGPHLHFQVNEDNIAVNPYNENNYLFSSNPPHRASYMQNYFSFDGNKSDGWKANWSMIEYPLSDENLGEWRVKTAIVNGQCDPGVDGPEYPKGLLAKDLKIQFRAKVENGGNPVNEGLLYAKDFQDGWNHSVPYTLISGTYTSGAYNTYETDLSGISGSDNLFVKQISLQLTNGSYGETETYSFDWINLFITGWDFKKNSLGWTIREQAEFVDFPAEDYWRLKATGKMPQILSSQLVPVSSEYVKVGIRYSVKLDGGVTDQATARAYFTSTSDNVFSVNYSSTATIVRDAINKTVIFSIPSGRIGDVTRIRFDLFDKNENWQNALIAINNITFLKGGEDEATYTAAVITEAGGGIYEPGNLSASSVSHNSVTLSWNQGLNTASNLDYHIYRSNSRYASYANEVGTTSDYSYCDGCLAPCTLSSNTTYYYWIKAMAGSESSAFSDSVCVTTQGVPGDGSVPTAPTDLRCAFVSASQIKVRWSAGANNPNNIADYKLFKGTTNDSNQATYWALTPYTEQAISNLSQTAYYFWVKAVNHENEESGFSEMAAVNMANYLYPPTNLTAINQNGSIKLAWSCQTTGAVFKVYRSESENFSSQSLVFTSWVDTGFDNNGSSGQTYYYRVCDSANGAVSDYSNIASAVFSTFPAPDSFRVVEVKPGQVKLAWENPGGTVYNYWIFRHLPDGTQQMVYAAYDTFYVDTTAVCGQTYSYKIRTHSTTTSDISLPVYATVPYKTNVYSDYIYLPDADSNGYAEIAGLYKRGEDSTLVSIKDLGTGTVIKSFFLGKNKPNSLAAINADDTLKLVVLLDSAINAFVDTMLFRIFDVGVDKETFVLGEPVDFQSVSVSYDQIRLSWGRGINTDTVGIKYNLYASQGSDSSLAQLICSVPGTGYTHAGLSPGDNWHYWLRASVGVESSAWVGPVTTGTNSLPIPTNLVARQVSGSKVVLGWTGTAGVSGYRVYRNGSYAGYTSADSLADFLVLQLTDYSYQVASVYGNFSSALSDALAVSTPYAYLSYANPVKGIEDMEFLPDLDNDSLAEIAALGIDSASSQPTVIVGRASQNKVLAAISFLDSGAVPLCFSHAFLSGNNWPVFTVMGQQGDTIKIETRSFYGTLLSQ